MDLISVVIPVFNVEKYLERCITSVVNQTYSNIEIILVDDGSPDQCPNLCDVWARKDNRIKVIHKQNEGLGMARNTGIENASGKYICFFDSDDYVDHKIIEKAHHLAKLKDAEIVTFGMVQVDLNGKAKKTFRPKANQTLFVGDEVRERFLPDLINNSCSSAKNKNLCMSMCTHLIKLDLIKEFNWRMASERDVISEDYYSLLILYNFVNRVAILEEAGYYYCYNEASLTHTYREDRYQKIKHFYYSSLEVIQQYGYCEEVKKRLDRNFLGMAIGAMKQLAISKNSLSQRLQFLKDIIKDDGMQRVLLETDRQDYTKKQKVLFYAIRRQAVALVLLLLELQAAIGT